MKIIRYRIMTEINYGTEEKPDIKQLFTSVSVPCSEKNLAFSKLEAYNGEVSVEDDGTPEPGPTQAEQLRADVDYLSAMTGVMLL